MDGARSEARRERQDRRDFHGRDRTEAGSPVDVRGAASGPITGLSASMVSGGLTWKGEGAEPKIAPGDLGAPATQGGKFVGITSGQAAVSMSLLTPTSSPRRSRSSVRTPRSPLSNPSEEPPLGHRAEVPSFCSPNVSGVDGYACARERLKGIGHAHEQETAVAPGDPPEDQLTIKPSSAPQVTADYAKIAATINRLGVEVATLKHRAKGGSPI